MTVPESYSHHLTCLGVSLQHTVKSEGRKYTLELLIMYIAHLSQNNCAYFNILKILHGDCMS